MDKQQEKLLVQKAQNGDCEAFNSLIENCNLLFFHKLKSFDLRAYDINDDILQETKIKTWQNIDKFNGESRFSTWAVRIMINIVLDYLRKEKTKNKYYQITNEEDFDLNSVPAEDGLPSKLMEDKDFCIRIKKKLKYAKSKLIPQHKQVFKYVFEQEKTYDETARLTNTKVGTIMSRVCYTRKYLQEDLKELYEECKG